MEDDLKQALEKISKLSEENNVMLKKIKRYFLWQRLFSVLYFLLIVGPIVIGIIYLPPLLKDAFSQYQDLLSLPAGNVVDLDGLMKAIGQQNNK
ncbi:MAG: hypothetical protein WC415_06225 [Patescibacteria group bacterium]|jgi:hypothetical protein